MTNSIETRKCFAKIYGTPSGNCEILKGKLKVKSLLFVIGLVLLTGILIGFLISPLVFMIWHKAYVIYPIFIVIFATMLYIKRYLEKTCNEFDSFETGIKGESIVGNELVYLPSDYTVFHSVKLPSMEWDFDHIVVSPYGVLLIETKNWNTPIKFEEGHLTYDKENYSRDPVKQLGNQAMALKEYLQKFTGLEKMWIQGIICFVGQKLDGVPSGKIENNYFVTNEKMILDLILNYEHKSIPEKEKGIIIGKLIDLCQGMNDN